MKKLKPVVIFTTFWDAAYLVDSKCVLFDWHGNIKKLNLQSEPCNFSVKSVALSHPSFEKISKLKGIFRCNRDRLDFFCQSCNYTGNADINAALNILNRFLTGKYGSCYKAA